MRKIFLLFAMALIFCPTSLGATRTITVLGGYYYNRPYYNNTYYNTYPVYTTTTVYPRNYTSSPTVNTGYYNPRDVLIGVSNKGTRVITPQYTTRTYYLGGKTKTNYYTPSYGSMFIPMRYGY